MAQDVGVYDLGEVQIGESPVLPRVQEKTQTRRVLTPVGTVRPTRPGNVGARLSGPGMAASLSLVFPGAGQLLAGEPAQCLFFASGFGFAVAMLRSMMATRDRIFPTLDLLGVPREAAGVLLGLLVLSAAAIHVAGVLHAHWLRGDRPQAPLHPVLAGLSSALVPGWGQILVGHRVRAALFLSGVWIVGAAWFLASPAGMAVLQDLGVHLSRGAREGWGPIALVTAPCLLYALAIYDAAMGAIVNRRSA